MDTFPEEPIQVIEGKSYLFGVFGDSFGKENNLCQVNWSFTGLKAMNILGTYILSAVVLAIDIEKIKGTKDDSDVIENFFWKSDANNIGEPLSSDCKADNDTVSNIMGESAKVWF
eukprot:2223784-Ditylum_brightwellii.AAC.1